MENLNEIELFLKKELPDYILLKNNCIKSIKLAILCKASKKEVKKTLIDTVTHIQIKQKYCISLIIAITKLINHWINTEFKNAKEKTLLN